jgi:hypothetical protein
MLLALAIAAAPVAAVAQDGSAAVLSVRAAEGSEGASQLLEGDGGALVAIGILGIIILAAYLLSDEDNPSSP